MPDSVNRNPTMQEMVADYLKDHGFDGLYGDWGGDGCGCFLPDLFPCSDPDLADCRAGYKRPCDCGDCDFHIGSTPDSKDQADES